MPSTNLIAATTAAATSEPFSGSNGTNISICCNTLQGAETITLQVYDYGNQIWADALSLDQKFQITATTNFMTIYNDSQTFRLSKSVTNAPVAVDTNSGIQFVEID